MEYHTPMLNAALLLLVVAGADPQDPSRLPQLTSALPAADAFKADLPSIFNVIWLESLFTGYGSSASNLRHYTYKEHDTVSINAVKTSYRLGPYETVGVQNNRAWFSELRNYAVLTPEELQRQTHDRQTLLGKIKSALPDADINDASSKAEEADLSASFDVEVVRREPLGGRSAILVALKPDSRYIPRTETGMLARRFSVRVWLNEESHDVIRLEAELQEPILLDLIFRKGSTITIERKAVGEQAWLPVKSEIAIPQFGRIVSEYSNFQKFSTEVILKFGETAEKAR